MGFPLTESQTNDQHHDSRRTHDQTGFDREHRSGSDRRGPTKAPPPTEAPTAETEKRVGVAAQDLSALYALESIKGFGPAKFREIYETGLRFVDVLESPTALPSVGKRGDQFRSQLPALKGRMELFNQRAYRQIASAARLSGRIVTYWSPDYPRLVLASNNPVPALYLIGSAEVLADSSAVACVGSRRIRPPYDLLHRRFAEVAVEEGFTVVSGFALGADTVGHRSAYERGGKTICVMPCGLDHPFPPENRSFWRELVTYPKAALVTEFPFGTIASALTLRKRNKLIVAFSRGVLMSQSSDKGGAMNAYRFALELKRPFATFEPDAHADTSGNRLAITDHKGDITAIPLHDGHEVRTWLQRLSYST